MRCFKFTFIFMLLVTMSSVYSQSVEIFGYYENEFDAMKTKGEFYQLNYNKLRVDLLSGPSSKLKFAANFDYITYHGKTDYQILDFLPRSLTSQIPEENRKYFIHKFEERNFLDNAYARLTLGDFDITIGKQQISIGTGYTWNPTDVFNFKNVVDPTYEQPGHNAVRADYYMSANYRITALYSPQENFDGSTKMIKFAGKIPRFDYSITFIKTNWITTNYLTSQRYEQLRNLYGFDFSGELFGLGLYGEFAHNQMEISKDYDEMVFGLNYTFDFQTYVMFEYYRNTSLKKNSDDYTLNDWMRYMNSENKSICQDQLFTYIQHPATDLISIGMIILASVSDGSVAVVPRADYNILQNVEISIFANFGLGKKNTAYSKDLGSGGFIRTRIYF